MYKLSEIEEIVRVKYCTYNSGQQLGHTKKTVTKVRELGQPGAGASKGDSISARR